MEQIFAVLGLLLMVAFLVESLVEYFLGRPFDQVPALQPFKWLLPYASALAGVGLAFYYRFDLVYLLAQFLGAEQVPAAGAPGMILTGLAVGEGAGFLNDLVSRFFRRSE